MKKPISATIDEKLIRWIDSELKDRLTYRNRSHLIEIALIDLRNKEIETGKRRPAKRRKK